MTKRGTSPLTTLVPGPLPGRFGMQIMPVIAMVLVVLLLGALLWLIERNEVEDERLTLIKDILWVEQTLRFHLTSDEERLQQLGTALAARQDEAAFLVQARHAVLTNPELDRILWHDAQGAVIAAFPPVGGPEDQAAAAPGDAFTMARSIGRRAYSTALSVDGRPARFEIHVPIFRDTGFAGMVVGVVSMGGLLDQHVPWWFAEKYQLAITGSDGTMLAAKSHMKQSLTGPSYILPFDPPGHGMTLVATVHGSKTNLVRNMLTIAILALAVAAIWSLWAVRRHSRRRMAAEQALLAEHAFRKAMEDSLTVGMRARDLSGKIIYVNPAFCRMVGWSAEDLIGCGPPMPYWAPDEMKRTLAMHRRVLEGNAPTDGFEIRFQRRNGEQFDALIYEAPLIDAQGRHTGWMGSVLDITERKHAEDMARQQQEKLQQTARLVTMGEMASTLAHELNQPLSAIASYNTGCLNKLKSGDYSSDELAFALGKLGVQAQRAGLIIRRIYDFVRKREPQLAPCLVGEIIENSVTFIASDARKRGVRIDFDKQSAPPVTVMADRILLEQVMLNLARNAIEAMSQTSQNARMLRIWTELADGAVTVRIADHGCGVEPDIADRLYKPFFTTKDEGMGMGLNICRSVIEFHQGRLWFEPQPDGGSIFQFTLPVTAS